ncbi:DinB family protein [Tessaracoccus sp. Z1128]
MSESPIPPQPPVPDTKDWTWVTERPCPECGFDATTVTPQNLPSLILDASARFQKAVDRRGAEARPEPTTWSVIEYGRHVADVFEVMTARLHLILDSDGAGAEFADWDQDAAAAEEEYWLSDANATRILIAERAQAAAKAWAEPQGAEWEWTGLRSNGSRFTTLSLGRYFAHDLVHHLHDVGA